MKKTAFLFIIIFAFNFGFAQSDYEIIKGMAQELREQGEFTQALNKYELAERLPSITQTERKDLELLKQQTWAEIDSLIVRVRAEKEKAETALAKANEMQLKVETTMFDKAVKEQNKEWKGYANMYEGDRKRILEKIDSLDLSSNALLRLPKEVAECHNLTKLNLYDNEIIILTAEIGNLSNLTELYLYKNQLRFLPKKIGNLINLTKLSLSNNELSSLPHEIGNLTNLTEFYLYKNELIFLPKEIGNLTNLTYLDLKDNQLTTLHEDIKNLINLKKLFLGGNNFSPQEIEKIEYWLPNCDIDW